MQYAEGTIGRVFAARLEDNEPVYASIEGLARRENVASAFVLLLGGARSAKMVTGPKQPSGPVEPIVRQFDDAREMVGVGTIHPSDQGPTLHLHAGFGRESKVLVGCPGLGLNAYLVVEVLIVELLGLDAARLLDPESGLKLLRFASPRSMGAPSP
jgi:predicted DNA-binding protein with PD1-like motif